MKRGFLDLLDPSNAQNFFGRLYRDHPVYLVTIQIFEGNLNINAVTMLLGN
jgi:hypothetical protein